MILKSHVSCPASRQGNTGAPPNAESSPGRLGAVDVSEVLLEPDPLRAALGVVHVVAEEDVVRGADVCRVEEVGRRAAGSVRRLRIPAFSAGGYAQNKARSLSLPPDFFRAVDTSKR